MIKIDVGTRREVGQYGDTHSVSLNTWHPDTYSKPEAMSVVRGTGENPKIDEEDDIPF